MSWRWCHRPPAWADNTTLGGAYSLMIGGHPSEAFLDNLSPERCTARNVVAGRSCVETQGGVLFDTDPAAGAIDTVVLVLRQDANTVLVSNDDAMTEPQSDRTSRGCFTAPASESRLIRVNRSEPGASFAFRVRMVEIRSFRTGFSSVAIRAHSRLSETRRIPRSTTPSSGAIQEARLSGQRAERWSETVALLVMGGRS